MTKRGVLALGSRCGWTVRSLTAPKTTAARLMTFQLSGTRTSASPKITSTWMRASSAAIEALRKSSRAAPNTAVASPPWNSFASVPLLLSLKNACVPTIGDVGYCGEAAYGGAPARNWLRSRPASRIITPNAIKITGQITAKLNTMISSVSSRRKAPIRAIIPPQTQPAGLRLFIRCDAPQTISSTGQYCQISRKRMMPKLSRSSRHPIATMMAPNTMP